VTSEPLLSVLVPAYGYPEGVGRILASLPDDGRLEVVVSDDSIDDGIGKVVRRHGQGRRTRHVYRHNRPRLGAIANWNALLDEARGRYAWLLHHDEFPLDGSTVPDLLSRLARADAPDVLVLDCVLARQDSGDNARHVPQWLRSIVVRHAPGYLMWRNVLGAPSVIVARHALYPRYDRSLKWMVDVEAYVRLFDGRPSIDFEPRLAVASVQGRGDSITAALAPELGSVERAERAALLARSPSRRALRWLAGTDATARAVRVLERGAWSAFRAVQRISQRLLPSPRRVADMRQALRRGLPEVSE